MKNLDKKIVLCGGLRTPIGHLSKSLASVLPEHLLKQAILALLTQTGLDKTAIDGVIIGWVGQGSHAPNVARVGALQAGIPDTVYAKTVQCNCVSGLDTISTAAMNILSGDGELYISGGTESMSSFPYAIRGARFDKRLRNLSTVKAHWDALWNDKTISIVDCIEEGLMDPVEGITMAQTAEICAQKFNVSREAQDAYAHETFRRCMKGVDNGFYARHLTPVKGDTGILLETDEYPQLRKKLVSKPEMFAKAPVIFERSDYPFEQFYTEFARFIDNQTFDPGRTKATVTPFNACVRSDAAAVIIVTTKEKARELGLKPLAEVIGWGYTGRAPATMGVAPADAAETALKRTGIRFDELSTIELHEAFAATVLSAFRVGKDRYGHDWQGKWDAGKLNPYGGSIPMGHPLAATGTRLVLNLIYAMQEDKSAELGMAAACASGGIGGAVLLKKMAG